MKINKIKNLFFLIQFGQSCCHCNAKFARYYCEECKHLTGGDSHPCQCEECGICR